MKKTFVVILFALLSIVTFSQNEKKLSISQNKKRLSIKVGTEYRITPISKLVDFPTPGPATRLNFNLDKNLSGTSVNYQIDYMVFKNFEIGFSQSIRYDHLNFENNINELAPNSTEFFSINNSNSALIIDYHIYAKKYFAIKNNKKLYFKLGLSLMNRGTDYSISQIVNTHPDGTIATIITDQYDLGFMALNTSIGITHKRFDFAIGAYFIPGSGANLNNDENNIILPYFKLSYRIF